MPSDVAAEVTTAPGADPRADSRTTARVVSVAASPRHGFSKDRVAVIRLLTGLGVEGDAHLGTTVQHRSRVRRDPSAPNLRQVHLLPAELLEDVGRAGHRVLPAQLGENVTTVGIDLLGLPAGTLLRLGTTAVVEVTGLRNPCRQIDGFRSGLLAQVVGRADDGSVVRRAGVMAVVRHDGEVRAGDPVTVRLPPEPHSPLQPV